MPQAKPNALLTKNMKPEAYEEELAGLSGLKVQEVMGITRNFYAEPVIDGSTGVYEIAGNRTLRADHNLIHAYSVAKQSLLPLGAITVDDLNEIRMLAMDYVQDGPNQPFHIQKPSFRADGKSFGTQGKLDPDVAQRLRKYGFGVEETPERFTIRYGSQARIRRQLESYLDELNRMINLRYPPEYIAAFAVQELLIIHPWADGNGRVARLIGQILYKKLTGKTIVFPKSFHEELGSPLEKLVKDILHREASADEPLDSVLGPRFENPDELSTFLYTKYGVLPEDAVVGHADPMVGDTPFGSFTYYNTRYDYSSLSQEAKGKGCPEFVYYGRPEKTLESAKSAVQNIFTEGRSTRGPVHRDLNKHIDASKSTHYGPSGFFPTSKSFNVAKRFAGGVTLTGREADYGVIFILYTPGAQILDVDGMRGYGSAEQEVLFSSTLNPRRVMGAVIYRKKPTTSGSAEKPLYLMNPNFDPRGVNPSKPKPPETAGK